MSSVGKKLIVIGAGPKAMAIASKNAVLAELGYVVPEVHVIEKTEVGAHWTGNGGFTNGRLPLGTSPEKDVGFPYRSTAWGADSELVDRRMAAFSWQSFLVAEGRYSDWVDRGRPQPEHRNWAAYLQWVWNAVQKRTTCHRGEVIGLGMEDNRWLVTYVTPGEGTRTTDADGIVVTGPGRTPLEGRVVPSDRVFTVESFWKSYERFRADASGRLALVGSGENAAAVAMALAEFGNANLQVDIVTPRGMAFTRGESFRENRVYSDASTGNWNELTAEDKRNFITRTDRGVFSVHAQSVLDRASNIDVVPGRVVEVTRAEGEKLSVHREYNGKRRADVYDYVVVATGADQLGFLRSLFAPGTSERIADRAGLRELTQAAVEERIDPSLALARLTPRLHLPMLSGLAQGPGFANLSCLGRLSDHILRPYVEAKLNAARGVEAA